MSTISKTHFERLNLEAEEAELTGKEKIAQNLSKQLLKNASTLRTEEEEAEYTYEADEFEADVEEGLWDIVTRVCDFFGTTIDSEKMQDIVSHYAEKIIDDIKSEGNISSSIGAYEAQVPGEDRELPLLEVEE